MRRCRVLMQLSAIQLQETSTAVMPLVLLENPTRPKEELTPLCDCRDRLSVQFL